MLSTLLCLWVNCPFPSGIYYNASFYLYLFILTFPVLSLNPIFTIWAIRSGTVLVYVPVSAKNFTHSTHQIITCWLNYFAILNFMTTVFQRLTIRLSLSLRIVFGCRQHRLYDGLFKGDGCLFCFFHITKCSEVSRLGEVWQLHIGTVLRASDFSVFSASVSCKRGLKM